MPINIPDLTGEIRLLQGQTVLENNKTIPELQLTDGSTLHMVLEPAKKIEVKIKLPSMAERKFTLSNNFTPSKVLQHLQNEEMLLIPAEDYFLLLGDKELPHDMPLHLYDINTVIQIKRVKIGLNIIDEYNDRLYVTVNRKSDTILDVKKKTSGTSRQNKMYQSPDQIRIYIQNGAAYNLLQDDCSIKTSGVENDCTLYMIYYDWGSRDSQIKFYVGEFTDWGKREGPKYTKQIIDFVGRESAHGRTALSVALRIQDQHDIPVQSMEIYQIYEEQEHFTVKTASDMWIKPVRAEQRTRTIPGIKQCLLHSVVPNSKEFVIFRPAHLKFKESFAPGEVLVAKTYRL